MIKRLRAWLTRRRLLGVTVEPVEQRPGFWPEWGIMTDDGFQPVNEVDHGTASSQVEKCKTSNHHPKSDPVFFERSESADTSAVRGFLFTDGDRP